MVVIFQIRKLRIRKAKTVSQCLLLQLENFILCVGQGVTCLLAHPPGPEAFETTCLGTQDIPRVTAAEPGGEAGAVWGRGLQPPADGCLPPSVHSLSDNGLSVAGVLSVLSVVSTCQTLAELHIR